MKLIIVDDEKLTREGLLHNIDWNQLGIHKVILAENGEEALSLVRTEYPDILLTDVRMPKRDGISLAKETQRLLPECSIIFMSGYSDKEYLKAAISLHAVRYVEKPVDLVEIQEAVSEAVSTLNRANMMKHSSQLMEKETLSRLALELTHPGYAPDREACQRLHLPASGNGHFTTMIFDIDPHFGEMQEKKRKEAVDRLEEQLAIPHLNYLYTIKNGRFLILHLYKDSAISSTTLKQIASRCQSCFKEPDFIITAIGKSVTSLGKITISYHSAVVLLQSGFFYESGSILVEQEEEPQTSISLLSQKKEEILSLLEQQKLQKAKDEEETLYKWLLHNRSFLPDQIKDIYYRFFSGLQNAAFEFQILSFDSEDNRSILQKITACQNMDALHLLFAGHIEALHQRIARTSGSVDTPTIFLIKEYIANSYQDPALSIKDISSHIHLSTSYLCTLFKSETGTTLNQFITDYRMEQAKILLRDPRNKITEISSSVGYMDGNYFGKSFKKSVGLSPSEFREREQI